MTTCRSCSVVPEPAGPDAAAARAFPAGGTQEPAALLLRVWREGGDLRCRLLQVTDLSSPPTSTTVAQGIDAICDEVRSWLRML